MPEGEKLVASVHEKAIHTEESTSLTALATIADSFGKINTSGWGRQQDRERERMNGPRDRDLRIRPNAEGCFRGVWGEGRKEQSPAASLLLCPTSLVYIFNTSESPSVARNRQQRSAIGPTCASARRTKLSIAGFRFCFSVVTIFITLCATHQVNFSEQYLSILIQKLEFPEICHFQYALFRTLPAATVLTQRTPQRRHLICGTYWYIRVNHKSPQTNWPK